MVVCSLHALAYTPYSKVHTLSVWQIDLGINNTDPHPRFLYHTFHVIVEYYRYRSFPIGT